MSRTGFERRELIAIAVGGVIGAAARWWITDIERPTDGGWFNYGPNTAVQFVETSAISWRTLAVNLIGTALLGAVLALRRAVPDRRIMWLALGTGFCGSLTTFSTLAVELATRFRGGLGGADGAITLGTNIEGFEPLGGPPFATLYSGGLSPLAAGLLYLLVSVTGGAVAFFAGRRLGFVLGKRANQ